MSGSGAVEALEELVAGELWVSAVEMGRRALAGAGLVGEERGRVLLVVGRGLGATGRVVEGLEVAGRAAEEGGGIGAVRLALSLCGQMERWDECVAWAERLGDLRTAGEWALSARAHEMLGARKQASRAYLACLRMAPLASEAVDGLARVGASGPDVEAVVAKRTAGTWAEQPLRALGAAGALAALGKHREAADRLAQAGWAEREAEQRLLAADLEEVGPGAGPDVKVLAALRLRAVGGGGLEAAPPPSLGSLLWASRSTPQGWVAAALAAGARNDLGRCAAYAAKGFNEAAKASVRERAALVVGHALTAQGRSDEAAIWYRRAGLQGLGALVKALCRSNRAGEALREAKAAYRLRPQWEGALSALADALLAHGAAGTTKAREVLSRCIKLGGPRARHVARYAGLEDDNGVALLGWATGSGSGGEAADDEDKWDGLVPRYCGANSGSLHLQYCRALLLASRGADALAAERKAAALGWPGPRERSQAKKLLAPHLDHSEDEDDFIVTKGEVALTSSAFLATLIE